MQKSDAPQSAKANESAENEATSSSAVRRTINLEDYPALPWLLLDAFLSFFPFF